MIFKDDGGLDERRQLEKFGGVENTRQLRCAFLYNEKNLTLRSGVVS